LPDVAPLGGGPMALDVVPPGNRDISTGEHDTRDVPIQEFDALVYQRFEFHGIRFAGRLCYDGIKFRIGVETKIVAPVRLERVGPVVGDMRNRHAVSVDGDVVVAATRFLPPYSRCYRPDGALDLQFPLEHVLHDGRPGELEGDIPDHEVQTLDTFLIPG